MSSSTSGSGLAARETRLARALARAVGAEAKLYAVVCAHDVAKARCLGRNAENGWSFLIDEAAFEALRVKFSTCRTGRGVRPGRHDPLGRLANLLVPDLHRRIRGTRAGCARIPLCENCSAEGPGVSRLQAGGVAR